MLRVSNRDQSLIEASNQEPRGPTPSSIGCVYAKEEGRKEGKGQLNRFTRLNQFMVESIQWSLNQFNPEVGGFSYKYLGSVQK